MRLALIVLLVPAVAAARPTRVQRDAWKTCDGTSTEPVDWCNFTYDLDPRFSQLATTLVDGRAVEVTSHVFEHDTTRYFRLADVLHLDIDGDDNPETLVVVEESTGPDRYKGNAAVIYVYDVQDGTPHQLGTIGQVGTPIRSIAAHKGVVTLRTPDAKLRWRLVPGPPSKFKAVP